MAIKTYRIYVSGKISSRHSNLILHQMLDSMGFSAANGVSADQIPSIRNMHRENEQAYFDVDIPTSEFENNNDPISIVESMKRYILENAVQYEDITTQPPKDM